MVSCVKCGWREAMPGSMFCEKCGKAFEKKKVDPNKVYGKEYWRN